MQERHDVKITGDEPELTIAADSAPERNWRDLFYRVWNWLRPILPFIQKPTASERPGMGAIPYLGGTTFRVWAPHAEAVAVTGDFNEWSQESHPLVHEEGGYWSADVPFATAGQQYKFVVRNGKTHVRTDPYARQVVGAFRNGVITGTGLSEGSAETFIWQPTNFQRPELNELVIYELHVGTFDESAEKPPGTFQGVIDKLPYLQQLGINAIELLPIKEFDGELSWGYNPAHIFAVEQSYGGLNGFKALVQAAHEHNIAVIVDVVYNHFGPQDLSLWRFDGWQKNELGGIYFYNDWRSKTPWGDTRPDYGRREVRRFIRDNVLFWLEECRVDGLRFDATGYIRTVNGFDDGNDIPAGWQLLQGLSDEIARKRPGSYLIAEDLQSNHWVTKQTQDGGAGFDSQWDAQFVHPIRHALITPIDDERDMFAVRDALQYRYNTDAFERVIFTESHDEVANGKARVPYEIMPESAENYYAKKRATLGAALVFTAPGVPMIFQGQEFLEDGWFRDNVPLDWSKLQRHEGIAVLFRDLIRLRRNMQGRTRGLVAQHINVHHVDNECKIIAFHRYHNGGAGDDVIVVANFANAKQSARIGLPRAGIWRRRFNSDLKLYDPEFGDGDVGRVLTEKSKADGMAISAEITISPYTALIFSQD